MKKKSKQKVIWILLAVLAVLLILFFALKNINEKKEKEEEAKAENEIIYIYEADSLSKFSYEDSEGTSMSFEKVDEEWRYSADTSVPLSVTTLSSMEESFATIPAVKEITDPDDLADYGLESPSYKLLVTREDGKEELLLVGAQTGENYYLMREEEEKVYTVSADLVGQMVWDVKSLVQKENFVSVTENNFVKEVITTASGTETVFDAADEEQAEAVTAVAQGFSGFYFAECADYHVTENTLADYGLDEANRTKIVLTYEETNEDGEAEEQEITFYVGSRESTGTYYYVQLEGSQMVNTTPVTSVQAVLGVTE